MRRHAQFGRTWSLTMKEERTSRMPAHRFAIGQSVRLRTRFGLSPRTAEIFRITGTLPERGNSPQYRIRSDDERHERVTTEDSLEEIEDGVDATQVRSVPDGPSAG